MEVERFIHVENKERMQEMEKKLESEKMQIQKQFEKEK